MGRAGRSGADDLTRGGTRYSDDIVRGGTRYRGGVPIVVGGGHGDDLAHLSRSSLDDAVVALPEVEGSAANLARKSSSDGLTISGADDTTRSFGRDYSRSVDDLSLTKKQHDELLDAFGTVQDLAEGVIEELASDDEDMADVAKLAKQREARARLELIALELEASLAASLTPDQLQQFRATLGSSEVVAYRLGKERPIKRADKQKKKPTKQPAKQPDAE